MVVMKYEVDCIKTMELFESYVNCIKLKQKNTLTLLFPIFLIESKKQWMIVVKYEGECIKNMEWFESYVHFIKFKQTNALALLFLVMVDWIYDK